MVRVFLWLVFGAFCLPLPLYADDAGLTTVICETKTLSTRDARALLNTQMAEAIQDARGLHKIWLWAKSGKLKRAIAERCNVAAGTCTEEQLISAVDNAAAELSVPGWVNYPLLVFGMTAFSGFSTGVLKLAGSETSIALLMAEAYLSQISVIMVVAVLSPFLDPINAVIKHVFWETLQGGAGARRGSSDLHTRGLTIHGAYSDRAQHYTDRVGALLTILNQYLGRTRELLLTAPHLPAGSQDLQELFEEVAVEIANSLRYYRRHFEEIPFSEETILDAVHAVLIRRLTSSADREMVRAMVLTQLREIDPVGFSAPAAPGKLSAEEFFTEALKAWFTPRTR